MKKIVFLLLPLLLLSCGKKINVTPKVTTPGEVLSIDVQPVYSEKNAGDVFELEHDAGMFACDLTQHLDKVIGKECRINVLPAQQIPNRYKCGTKYRADSIIHQYHKAYRYGNTICLCFTYDDISTTVHGVNNYGIMGLGYHPGKVCIISTARIPCDDYWKAAAHEILHNLGLPHCKYDDPHCLMCDAKGKSPHFEMKNDICDTCRKALGM